MGQRFQVYVNYGDKGENLFAMHLQWCWGPFSIIRAHQLVSYLDEARQETFNPFGLGERGKVGGFSFDGRREDLYVLKALTEINMTSKSIVEGHDLMQEQNGFDEWRFKEGELASFPKTVTINPLAQDNNDGFLVVQATDEAVKYAFCKDASDIEPVGAAEYLAEYPDDMDGWKPETEAEVLRQVKELDGYPLLTKDEMEQIFDKTYDKRLNIENFEPPKQERKHTRPLSDLASEAKERTALTRQPPNKASAPKQTHDQER